MWHHEESPDKPQYNMAALPFMAKSLHFALSPPVPLLAKNFQTPHFHQF